MKIFFRTLVLKGLTVSYKESKTSEEKLDSVGKIVCQIRHLKVRLFCNCNATISFRFEPHFTWTQAVIVISISESNATGHIVTIHCNNLYNRLILETLNNLVHDHYSLFTSNHKKGLVILLVNIRNW